MCFNCFKALNANSDNGIDVLVASISSVVYPGNNSMYIIFNINKSIDLYFNGSYTKYKRNYAVLNQYSISPRIRIKNIHIQMKI